MSRELAVATPHGPARWLLDGPQDALVVLALGHGAGGGVDTPDLSALAHELPPHGVLVARFEQPWRTAGKRVAPAPPRLDQAWLAGLPVLREVAAAPLVVGGRSAGARVACRTAGAVGAARVLLLSFPLHPPGRPEASRAHELALVHRPLLAVQGERDPFGSPDELAVALAGLDAELVTAPGCRHELAPAKQAGITPEQMWRRLGARVAGFVLAAADPE